MPVVRSTAAQTLCGPSPRSRQRPGAAWLLAAALSACASCATGAASAVEAPRHGGGAAHAAVRPWWSAFGGEEVDALMRAAEQQERAAGRPRRRDAPPAAFRVMQAYVALKVDSLSLRYIEQARHAARQQHRLILAKALAHDDFARELAHRLRRTEALLAQQARQRDQDLAALAALCGMPPTAVTALLEPSLRDASWPSQDFEVPASIPAALLAARPDVALAISLRGTQVHVDLGGAIEPSLPMRGRSGEDASRGDVLRAAPDVLGAARNEVGEALARLRVHRAVALSVHRQVAAARADFEAAQRRRDSEGRFPEVQALEDLQTLLAALRASAIADAELTRAWIGLTRSLGGTAIMRGLPAPERGTPDQAEARAISNLPIGLPRECASRALSALRCGP